MKKIALIIGSMIAGGIISAAGFTRLQRRNHPQKKRRPQNVKSYSGTTRCIPIRGSINRKSPFMDMDLVPKYADEESSASGVRIDPTQTQNLG